MRKVTLAYHVEVTHGVQRAEWLMTHSVLKYLHDSLHNAHLKEHKILKKGG